MRTKLLARLIYKNFLPFTDGQFKNINNPDNSIEYEEEQFERRASFERRVTSSSPPNISTGPLATSARKTGFINQPIDVAEMESPGTPTSTSTLQANGHRLPRPHVSLIKQHRKDSGGFIPKTDYDVNFGTRQLPSHHVTGHNYYQEGKQSKWHHI